MAKEEVLEFEGSVIEVLPDGRFRVKLDSGHEIVAYTAGRMKRHRIRAIVGDRVSVEMTPYDLEKGRMVYRHKTDTGPRVSHERRMSRHYRR
jgi:translation initiation factor IF-1